jgi:cysteine-rich repeat protein
MRIGIIAINLTSIFIVFFWANIPLAKDGADFQNQVSIIMSKHRPTYTDALESIIELCNTYELTNNPLPLFCLNCGNGKLEPSEQCDDGNNSDYDGCDKDCFFEHPPSNEPFFLLDLSA